MPVSVMRQARSKARVGGTNLADAETAHSEARASPTVSRGRHMRHDSQFHLPLRLLALCLDCDEGFEINNRSCPACGSNTWIPLSRFLERQGAGSRTSLVPSRLFPAQHLKRMA